MAVPAAIERQVMTRSAEETQALGASLAAHALPGDVICLWGELGAGKTQLAKGFGAGLGVAETINSPSFILMAEYPGRLRLFHVDLYRLDGAAEAVAGGLLDERQADGVTLVEWPERLASALPAERLDVVIEGAADEGAADDPRQIHLRATDRRHARYVETLR
jgi:tRNA threonylcarbamoyladenosine biosynthesis protein TsaE